ncbi:MAG: RNA pseudouridine synthase [Fuerstiella sp.]|nr:RNA pseudouridine synthase [Fuerstiella sp.]
MNNDMPAVLLEDNHCLAIAKPAGLLTMGDDTGDMSAADLAKEYLRQKYAKPGNVFLGVVHRLDRPVSGTLLFARTSKAASRLSDQFRRGIVRKTYIARVEGDVKSENGERVDWLLKDKQRNHVSVVPAATKGARECRLRYRVIKTVRKSTLVEIHPLTGRSHQIRVQLAHMGHPVAGDVRYGAIDKLGSRIMLHAARLEFIHPTLRKDIVIDCHLSKEFEL